MNNKSKNFKGFTLIELLVTITIIGILAGTSVSTFSGYQEKARIARAQQFASETDHKLKSDSIANDLSTDSASFDELADSRHIAMSSGVILMEQENDIILSDDTPFGTGKSFKVIGRGMGSDLETDDTYNLNLKNEISIMAWIKDGIMIMIRGHNESYSNFIDIRVGGENGHAYIKIGNSGHTYKLTKSLKEVSKWHHIMGSYDHKTKVAKLYIDGKLEIINKLPNISYFPNGKLKIPKLWISDSPESNTTGLIDNIGIYSVSIKGGDDSTDAEEEQGEQQ